MDFFNYIVDTVVNFVSSNVTQSEIKVSDAMLKDQIIEYIKNSNPKNTHLPENYDKTNTIDVENRELIALCIEIQKKVFELYGEHKPTTSSNKKKQYFVKPKFDKSKVSEKVNSSNVKREVQEFKVLYDVPSMTKPMDKNIITLNDYNTAFNDPSVKKDMIGMSKQILSNITPYLKQLLINAFNRTYTDINLIEKISIAKGSYVYKDSKKGKHDDIESFRPIMSIPNVVSHMHRILNARLMNYLVSNNYLNTNIQKGYVSSQKSPMVTQIFKVKAVLSNANKNKKTAAVLFLDVSNAFGNVCRENLWKILKLYNVDEKFINYISTYYDTLSYYVNIGGQTTENFKWGDGLVQGCPLSGTLFITALNYVLVAICKKYEQEFGYTLNGNKLLVTAFADDMCLITNNLAQMDIVFKELESLLTMIGLPLNVTKSALMIVGNCGDVPDSIKKIPQVECIKYLGEYLSKDGTSATAYTTFVRTLYGRLLNVEKKQIPLEQKKRMFTGYILPWIRRRTPLMYDISHNQRMNITKLVKEFCDKMDIKDFGDLFINSIELIKSFEDPWLNVDDLQIDHELQQDIDIANLCIKGGELIVFNYDTIKEDDALDAKLEALANC